MRDAIQGFPESTKNDNVLALPHCFNLALDSDTVGYFRSHNSMCSRSALYVLAMEQITQYN